MNCFRVAVIVACLGPATAPAVEPMRLTRDGARKLAPTFVDGGTALVYAAHERPNLVALVQLDWHGEVLLAKGPPGPDRPTARRQQALAAGSAIGLVIMREILRHKLAGEAAVAKVTSLVVKVGALAFILFLPVQFALDLQLLGGLWILQTFPAVVFGLFVEWFTAPALLLGWLAGFLGGTWLAWSDGLKP